MGGHGGHPNVRVRRITHSRANCDTLELMWQDVEHDLARDERGRAERDGQHVARAVVVAASLWRSLWDMDRIQRRHPRRVELVERSVHVPAVKARNAGSLVGRRDDCLVEGCMGSGPQCDALDAIVVIDGAIADELHLRHARDSYQV